MTPQVYFALFGWIPLVVYLFTRLEPQWAAVISFVGAWLFLPQVDIPMTALPDYGKMSSTCYAVLLATLLFNTNRFALFRLTWFDLPMLVWCLSPFISSIATGLTVYDAVSLTFEQIVTWGLPYYIGRIYIGTLNGLRKLVIAMFIGGLLYVPLCLYEVRMSPQLHRIVYGVVAREGQFAQSIRYGGYRPSVFMRHGLSVGMWMMAATLIGIWLWRTGILHTLWGIAISWYVGALFVTFIAVKSTGAYIYLALGLLILFTAKYLRTALPLLLLMSWIGLYVYMGVNGTISGDFKDQILTIAADTFGPERAQSLEFRFDNEEVLGDRARESFMFGWPGYGRNRVYDEWGKATTIPDSLWIIAFGGSGIIGTVAIVTALLLPSMSFVLLRYPAYTWTHPKVAPSAVLAVILVLYMFDSTLNNQVNPIYTFAAGGLTSLIVNPPEKRQLNAH